MHVDLQLFTVIHFIYNEVQFGPLNLEYTISYIYISQKLDNLSHECL